VGACGRGDELPAETVRCNGLLLYRFGAVHDLHTFRATGITAYVENGGVFGIQDVRLFDTSTSM
jgi:hypothetical protein